MLVSGTVKSLWTFSEGSIHPVTAPACAIQEGESLERTRECEATFTKSKRLLLERKVVVHYDTKKPVRLAFDASPYGVGAVISQEDSEEKPIAFASRSLSDAESKYAQIEKEALSIIFEVRKFHKYLYGRKFAVITDHKLFWQSLALKSAVPTLAALRMQRWALIPMAYSYNIEYHKSADHANANALSRLPRPDKDKTAEENRIFYFLVVDDLPVPARFSIEQSQRVNIKWVAQQS